MLDKFWNHGRFLTFEIHSPSQLIQDDKSFCEEIIKTKNHGSISQIISSKSDNMTTDIAICLLSNCDQPAQFTTSLCNPQVKSPYAHISVMWIGSEHTVRKSRVIPYHPITVKNIL